MSTVPYRQPLVGVNLDHALQQGLAVWGNEVGHVENPTLHLFQELAQVVMVKRQGTLREREGNKELKQNRWGWIWMKIFEEGQRKGGVYMNGD